LRRGLPCLRGSHGGRARRTGADRQRHGRDRENGAGRMPTGHRRQQRT
jgi:hypothetical protein